MKEEKKKKLMIAFDTGFDGGKIVINNELVLNVPFVVKDVTSQEMDREGILEDPKNFICYDNGSRQYLVGAFAKKAMWNTRKVNDEDRYKIANFYRLRDRFASEEFKIAFDAIIGYGLVMYEEYTKKSDEPFLCSDLLNYDIILGVALPHEHVKTLWDTIKPFIEGEHEFNLVVGTSKIKKFNLTYSQSYCYSQALSAFYCALINADGTRRYKLQEFAPAVVILAGYKTLERFEYTENGTILSGTDNNSSNETYAMFNVNHDVASRIMKEIPGSTITEYEIESALFSGKSTINVLNDKKDLVCVPIAEYRKEALEKKCNEMIEDTRQNFDYFRTTSTIIVAGGTGELYYEYIKNWCDSQDALKGKSVLVREEINGEEYGSVFAVAIGLSKLMRDRLGKSK